MSVTTVITAAILRNLCACPKQVALLDALYPDGVELTRAALLAAASAGLDVGWYARRAIPSWTAAGGVYERATDAAFSELQRAEASAEAEHERAMDAAQAARLRAEVEIEAEHERATDAAQTVYLRAEFDPELDPEELWAELDHAKVSAQAEYRRAVAAAREAYRRAEDAAQAECEKTKAAAREAYRLAEAAAFATALEPEEVQP